MRVGFRFSNVTFQPSRVFHSRIFSYPSVDTNEQSTGSCPRFLGPISLLYKQLLQYTLLKSLTVPSTLLTKFPKKFHMKLLASDIIFTKLSTKTLLLWRCCVSFEYQGLLQNTPASFLLLFVNVQASLKTALQKSSNIQLVYNMTWTRHKNGAGASPTFGRQWRRADQLRSASAASAKCQWWRRTALVLGYCRTATSGWVIPSKNVGPIRVQIVKIYQKIHNIQ